MVTCADTSFLFSLYGNDAHSARAVAWMKKQRAPLALSVLNEYELANALRFAEFRKLIGKGDAVRLWADFETDVSHGRLVVQICNLAEVVDEAKNLSSTHTTSGGHRGFDILHVATAVKLGASRFLTFDANQKKLAHAAGMRVPW